MSMVSLRLIIGRLSGCFKTESTEICEDTNREFQGEKINHDPDWEGPIPEEKRTRTNPRYQILLGTFSGIWLAVGFYAYFVRSNGEISHDERLSNEQIDGLLAILNVDKIFKSLFIALRFTPLTAFFCIFYILLLHRYPRFTVYTAILNIWIILFWIIVVALYHYFKDEHRPEFLFAAASSAIIFVIKIIYFMLYRRRIVTTCKFINEASEAIRPHLSFSILTSSVSFILQTLLAVLTVLTFFYLWSTSSKSTDGTSGQNKIFYFVLTFGFLWYRDIIQTFFSMILSGCYASWYWKMEKKNYDAWNTMLRFMKIAIGFHVGTVVFGSFILVICQVLYTVFKLVQSILMKSCSFRILNYLTDGNRKVFRKIDKSLKFLNSNAFIFTTVHGTEFFQAAKDAFNMFERNSSRVVRMNDVVNGIFMLGQLYAISLTALSSWIFCAFVQLYEMMFTTLIVSIVVSFFMTESLFVILRTATNTIFHCVLEDYERNDGTDEKPYYMSSKLKKLLIK